MARNEGKRYLDAVLGCLPTDAVHVYDDMSTDDTVEIAHRHGAKVSSRSEGEPSFLDNEGAFRQAAWESFESLMAPREGDWVLAVDCDEVLVAVQEVQAAVASAIHSAQELGAVGVDLPIPEVWEFFDGKPWKRLDGYWDMLSAPRLFSYRRGGRFADRSLACGSVPTYVSQGHLSHETHGLALAHLGYVDPKDRVEKYARYVGKDGHGSAHVASIRQQALLGSVEWLLPPVWKGSR